MLYLLHTCGISSHTAQWLFLEDASYFLRIELIHLFTCMVHLCDPLAGSSGMKNICSSSEYNTYHRVMEWFGLEDTFKDYLVLTFQEQEHHER